MRRTKDEKIHLSTVEPSASTYLNDLDLSTFRPGAVVVQNIADSCTSSDIPDVPTLPSPTPFLYNILSTGPHLSLLAPSVLQESRRPWPPFDNSGKYYACPGSDTTVAVSY